MYKFFFILILILNSCNTMSYPGFEYENFNSTPAYELAKAVENSDIVEIKRIVKGNYNLLDFKDPIHNMSLLSLAIVNENKVSFEVLLELGANPNLISGNKDECTPFSLSIEYNNSCDAFFVNYLIKNRASINNGISYVENGVKRNTFPLFLSISKYHNGEFCQNIVELLVENGADLKIKNTNNLFDIEEDVFYNCLKSRNMIALEYLLIRTNKKPKDLILNTKGLDIDIIGNISLYEILKSNVFEFNSYPENEKAKMNILNL